MAKVCKCDKCGKINDLQNSYIVEFWCVNYKNCKFDLCPECADEIVNGITGGAE